MQLQIHDQAEANFPVKISGGNVIVLCDIGSNMSFMSYTCHMKLKDLPSLKMVSALSVDSATGHDICPVGLTCCKV